MSSISSILGLLEEKKKKKSFAHLRYFLRAHLKDQSANCGACNEINLGQALIFHLSVRACESHMF